MTSSRSHLGWSGEIRRGDVPGQELQETPGQAQQQVPAQGQDALLHPLRDTGRVQVPDKQTHHSQVLQPQID